MSELRSDTRVRMIGSRGWTGTFRGYYAPLDNGTRNVDVSWDHGFTGTIHESQIEAVRCQHCGIPQYENQQADPALASMAYLCWKCVKPWKAA